MNSHDTPRPEGGPRDGHVGEWIADYLFDRLDPSHRSQVEEHLKSCDDCREDLRFAEGLRESVHLSPERIVDMVDGGVPTTESEREHLRQCGRCREELEVLSNVVRPAALEAAASPPQARRSPRRARSPRRWQGAAAVTFFAAAAVLLLTVLPRSGDELAGLARIEPLPVRVTRSAPEPGSYEALRLEGLTAYRDANWARAERALGEALAKRPSEAELWLYRGSAQLALENAALAAESLRRAAELGETAVADEATWQRVQALLTLEDAETAREELQSLAQSEGLRAADAREQLDRMP